MSDTDLSGGRPQSRRITGVHRLPLDVWDVGNEPVDAIWDQKVFCNTFWRIYISDRPGLALEQDGHHLPYRPDAITVIPAWSTMTFHADTRVRHAFIHFGTPDWPSPLVCRFFPRALSLGDADLVERLRVFARNLDNARAPRLQMSQATALAIDTLARIIDRWPTETRTAFWQATQHNRLDRTLSFIEEHLQETVAVADLARLLGVGDARCIRLFKEQIGQTPTQYILERRVARAAALLCESDLPLDAIARTCGFPNRRYLGRVFRSRMGVPPGAYRRRHQLSLTHLD